MTALTHPQENNKSSAPARPRSTTQAEVQSSERRSKAAPDSQDTSLFGELLQPLVSQLSPPIALAWDAASQAAPMRAQPVETLSSPVRAWQQIEPPLCGMVETQPSGPVSMTLLLPVLGEVDARISPFPAGWDISLRLAPQAMAMIAPHQERCRESLRRRMACAVRLRFEQRGGHE